MPFKNRIRLPLYISKAQFPTERNIFRKANGETKTLSVIVRNTYAGITDYLPEDWHRKLVIALSHDEVQIENERYLTDIVLDSDYDIEWQDFKNYPIAQAKFTVQVSPFNATNSNCQTCEEATQLSLVDDYFEGILEEGTSASFDDVTANDSICCHPFVLSITSYNTQYISAADFTAYGVLQVTLKTPVPTGTNILLVTYRVTCPDGSYDEANVYGDVTGTGGDCNPPSNIVFSLIDDTTATVTWTAASPAPTGGYLWSLYDGNNPAVNLQNGNTAGVTVNLTGLVPNYYYLFQVQSLCDDDVSSTPIQGNFTTTGDNSNCANFILLYLGGGGGDLPVITYTYMDCNGVIVNDTMTLGFAKDMCAFIETGATSPFYFAVTSQHNVSVTYSGPC